MLQSVTQIKNATKYEECIVKIYSHCHIPGSIGRKQKFYNVDPSGGKKQVAGRVIYANKPHFLYHVQFPNRKETANEPNLWNDLNKNE